MLYELWIAINMLLALVGCAYNIERENFPMLLGWFVCFTGWLGLL